MSLVIGPLNEADLDDADSIFRLSFARFYGLADPAQMFGDIDYVRTRWRTAPNAAFSAFLGGSAHWLKFRRPLGERRLYRTIDPPPRLLGSWVLAASHPGDARSLGRLGS